MKSRSDFSVGSVEVGRSSPSSTNSEGAVITEKSGRNHVLDIGATLRVDLTKCVCEVESAKRLIVIPSVEMQ